MKIVYFTGAGASVPFGYPTTEKFIKEIREKDLPRPFKSICKYFEERLNGRVFDIEEVLWELDHFQRITDDVLNKEHFMRWYLLNENFNGPINKISEEKNNINQLRSKINEEVYNTYWREPDKGQLKKIKDAYRKLFPLLAPPLHFFTTNYDLCIEENFRESPRSDLTFTDGFEYDKFSTVRWNSENFMNKDVCLYKLHGSINWKRKHDLVWKAPIHDMTNEKDNAILYPGFKGEPIEEPFIFLHNRLRKCLMECEYCLVIGFSFRDEFINKIFIDSLDRNKNLQILVWNPEMPKRLFHSEPFPFPLERLFPYEKKFGDDNEERIADILLSSTKSLSSSIMR